MILSEVVKICHELDQSGTAYAVVTITKIDAHVPQEVGGKMIVTASGLHAGTIGGGKFEARGIQLAQKQLEEKSLNATLHRIDLNQDLGMVCGGVGTIFIESTNHDAWSIALYGAGHVGQALADILSTLNCQLFCIDSRPEWLDRITQKHKSRIKTILTDDFGAVPATLPAGTYHVIATPGHAIDLVVLRQVLKIENAPYIGVIGSVVKARKVRATLQDEGFTESDLKRFHCPMGLPFGNNTPPEVALSIAAQLLERRQAAN